MAASGQSGRDRGDHVSVAIGPPRNSAAPNNNVAVAVTTDIDRPGYRMHRIKIKNPSAPAAKRIDEEDWSK